MTDVRGRHLQHAACRAAAMAVAALLVAAGPDSRAAAADSVDAPFRVHDPSRPVFDGGRWWVLSSGKGIAVCSSADSASMRAWKPEAPAFGSEELADFWAPDLVKVGDTWYLFYAIPETGTQNARIGVAITKSIASGDWRRVAGEVVRSASGDRWWAIDPAPLLGPDGRLWLAYGSHCQGVFVQELDPNDPTRAVGQPAQVANVSGRVDGSIEGAYLHYRDGWYYLFVNVDDGSSGDASSYRVRVGRSRSADGPYQDRGGADLREGGGTLFLAGSGPEIGPGQVGFAGDDVVTYHYYPHGSSGSDGRLGRRSVVWTAGWPEITYPSEPLKAGVYSIQVQSSRLYLRVNTQTYPAGNGDAAGAPSMGVDQWPWKGSLAERWRLAPLGNGLYRIESLASDLRLCDAGGSNDRDNNDPGSVVATPAASPVDPLREEWRLIAQQDGSFQIQSAWSGKVVDIRNYSQQWGEIAHLWKWLDNGNQRFWIRPPEDKAAGEAPPK